MRVNGSPGFATGAVFRCHFVAEGFLSMLGSNALGYVMPRGCNEVPANRQILGRESGLLGWFLITH